MDTSCPTCGKPFSQKRRGRCYHCHWAAVKAKGKTPGRPRRGTIKACEVCGETFYTTPHQQARARRFCSVRCKGVWNTQEYERTWKDRFWAKVRKGPDCWEWQGKRYQSGYGISSIRGKSKQAHRVSWEIHNGPIREGAEVRHRCDNRLCVRPDHLQLGSSADNAADRVIRERKRPKLARDRVRAITALHAGGFDPEEIAAILRLRASTIKAILVA